MSGADEGALPEQHKIRGGVLLAASWAARFVGAAMSVQGMWDVLTDVFSVLQTSPPRNPAFARFVSLYLPFPFNLLAAVLLASAGRLTLRVCPGPSQHRHRSSAVTPRRAPLTPHAC